MRPERIELSSEDPQSPILSVKLWAPFGMLRQAMWDIITQELNLRRFEGDFVAEPLTGFVDEGIGGFDERDFVAYFFDDFFALSRV